MVPIMIIKADAGWDVDYGGGGGGFDYGGGYDYDGGYSYHGNGVSGESDPLTIIIVFVIILVICIIISIAAKKSGVVHSTHKNIMSDEEILAIDPNIDQDSVINESFELLKKVQYSWSSFNFDELKTCLSDELYNNYKMQLDTLKMKNQKNLMEDITFIDGKIISLNKTQDIEEMVVKITIQMRDYVVDSKTNALLRGSDKQTLEVTYYLTLIKAVGNTLKNCPSCGAPINDTARHECEYCNSVIIKTSEKYVMSKKEIKNQRRV